MTCAEHLIENAIIALGKNKPFDSDINAESTSCTAEEAYEMAQHVVYSLYDGKFPEGLYSLKDCQLPLFKNENCHIYKNRNKELDSDGISSCIERLFSILTELDARERSHNCAIKKFNGIGWEDLCSDAIKLLKIIRDGESTV